MGAEGLLERDTELAVIWDAARAAVRGQAGSMLLIEGPAGIGKTSLQQAAATIAATLGATVLQARGSDLERNFSFGVARQLLEGRVAELPAAERERVLDGAARPAAPIVNPRAAVAMPAREETAAEERAFMVTHGLYWLVCNLADTGPLFLGVDDAQWCDPGSARFLGYLARRLDELPVLLAVTIRSGEPGSAEVAGALSGAPARVLRPQPLSTIATMELVRRTLAPDAGEDFCRECHRVSGGNPFLLGALLNELAAERAASSMTDAHRLAAVHPPAVTRTLLARLARLGPDAGALARAVAVLGNAELWEAAALADIGLGAAADAADALAEADVLTRRERFEFAHPLLREVVYESIAPPRRALDHQRAATLLAKPGGDGERMASHLLRGAATGDADAVRTLRQAADQALQRGAVDAACAYLRRALQEPPEPAEVPAVTRELATAELLAHEPSAIGRLHDALAVAGQPVARAEIGLLLGKALVNAGQPAAAGPVLTSAIGQLGGQDSDLAVRLETWRSGLGVLDRRYRAELEQRLPTLRPLAERSGLAGRGLLILLAYRAAMDGAPHSEIVELADHGLDHGRFLATETDGLPVPFAMRLLAWIDELDRADQVRDSLLAAARAGSIVAFAIAAVCAASTALRRGNLAAAEAEARTATETAARHGLKFYEPFARALLGEALLERGDLGQATAAVNGMNLDQIRGSGPGALLLYVRGRLRGAAGDRDGATADLTECGETYEAMGYCNPNILPWRSALAQVTPRAGEAQGLATEELARARHAGQPRGIGIALRACALLSPRHEQLSLLQEAAETLTRSPSALELARVLTDQGTALARSGQRAAAREPLQQAMDLAARCGAQPLAQGARDELRALGARPRRERLTGIDSLTPGELGVARLAADGLTTRQIAQALFVSAKTVSTHLGHIYGKLAINNREDLTRIVRENNRAPQLRRNIRRSTPMPATTKITARPRAQPRTALPVPRA